MAAGSSAVISGVVINAVITLVCLTLFSLLRGAKLLKKYYAPKRFSKEQAVKPRKLPAWYLSWVWPVLRYPERDIIEESGLDSAIYLRVITYSTEVMGYISVWCLAAVLPVNLTGGEIDVLMPDGPATNGTSSDDSQYDFTDFDKLSLSNVAAGSPRLWVHLASVYVVTVIVVWALWRYNRETVLLRLMYLANAEPAAEAHTVLVTDIPGIRPEDEPQDYTDEEIAAGGTAAAAAAAGQQSGAATTSAAIKKMEMVSPHASETSDRPLVSGSVHGATFLTAPGGDSPGSHASAMPPTTGGVSEDTGRVSASGAPANGTAAANGSSGASAAAAGNGVGSTAASGRADDGGEGGAAAGGAGTAHVAVPVPVGRKISRYPYDLKDHSLQPRWQARKALASGVSPHDFVEHEFRAVYPAGSIVSVNMVNDCEELTPLVDEFNKVQMALEDYLDECEHRLRLGLPTQRKQLRVFGSKFGEWGKARGYGRFHKVDAFDHWTARLQELRRLISEGQTRAIRRPSAAAFVTFSSRWYQTVAATSLHANDTTVWSVQPAPMAFEVVWQNLAWPAWRRASQSALMWGLFWLMACFYIIPIAALQGLIDVPNLAKSGGLATFFNAPVVKQLVEAIVPGLALKVFLLLVPFLLAVMVRASGAISQYRIDFGVVSRFFIFQIIVVFFGSVISSSFFSQLEQWINDPSSVVTVLGTSVPQGTTFFITYVLVLMGAGSVQFLRLPGLLLFGLMTWLSGSPRARTRLWQRQYTMLGNTVVGHMMVLLYGIVFCVINPVMCPVALLYFVVAAVQERYNMIYVFRRHYDSAGRLWGTVFHQVMIMVYLFQAVLLGLLAVKKFPYSPLLLPLMAATAASHYVAVKRFAQPWKVIALHDAASLDRLEAEQVKAMTAAASLAGEAFQDRPLGSMSRRPLLPALSSASSSAAAIDAMDIDLSQEQPPAEERWSVPLSVEEEARRVQGAYLAPPFKVPLDIVDKLTAAAAEMAARVDEATDAQLRGAKRGPKNGPPAAVEPLRRSAQPSGGGGPDADNDVEAGKGHQRRQPRQSEGDED